MVTTPSNTRFQSSAPSPVATSVAMLRPAPNRDAAPRTTNLFSLPNEPEDASLTGGTRSLDRRLLALNLAGSIARFGAVAEVSPASRQSTAA